MPDPLPPNHTHRSDSPWSIIRKPVLDALADDIGTFDACLCDPPYGLKFMGKGWDHGVPSSDVWRAARAHLRPGALVLAFGGSRTWHRLAVGIEDAGLEIRDTVFAWLYGQGWPKPADVGKMIDKRLGATREVIADSPYASRRPHGTLGPNSLGIQAGIDHGITAPGSPEAAHWDGYHAALKPACEPVVVGRVSLEGGLADNALAHGVAGYNVDGCRIGVGARIMPSNNGTAFGRMNDDGWQAQSRSQRNTILGRWPTNVILMCDDTICGPGDPREIEHRPGCHVYELDRQSGPNRGYHGGPVAKRQPALEHHFGHGMDDGVVREYRNGDGGASQFFYTGKVSSSERGSCAHPCMKPLALCEYLARLILPPVRLDGAPRRILVPFSGSGSEMIGAMRAGWDEVVGIEYDAGCDNPSGSPDHWADVAEQRIGRFTASFAAELELSALLTERGELTSRDFKVRGLDPRSWINAGFVRRDPAKRTRIVPGREVFAPGHRPETREWYRLRGPGYLVD